MAFGTTISDTRPMTDVTSYSQLAATPIPANARHMLNGILVVQNPLARFAIAQRAVPATQSSFDPLV